MLVAIFASLCIGAYPIPFQRAAQIVLHLAWPFGRSNKPPWDLKELSVVEIVRLPRVLLATLAGTGLGMAGTALQGMMRNPLVSPDVVGVTSGAAFGGVLAMLLELPPAAILILSFCGGICAMNCTFGLAKMARTGSSSLLLNSSWRICRVLFPCPGWIDRVPRARQVDIHDYLRVPRDVCRR